MSDKVQNNMNTKFSHFEPVLSQKHIAKPSETMHTGLSPRKKEIIKEEKEKKQNKEQINKIELRHEFKPSIVTKFDKQVQKEDHIGQLTNVTIRTAKPTQEIKASINKKPYVNLYKPKIDSITSPRISSFMSNQHKIRGQGKSEFHDQNEPLQNEMIPKNVSDKHQVTNRMDIDDQHIKSNDQLKETFTWDLSSTKTRNPYVQSEYIDDNETLIKTNSILRVKIKELEISNDSYNKAEAKQKQLETLLRKRHEKDAKYEQKIKENVMQLSEAQNTIQDLQQKNLKLEADVKDHTQKCDEKHKYASHLMEQTTTQDKHLYTINHNYKQLLAQKDFEITNFSGKHNDEVNCIQEDSKQHYDEINNKYENSIKEMTQEQKNRITELQHAIQDSVNKNITLSNDINLTEGEIGTLNKDINQSEQVMRGLNEDKEEMNNDLKQYQELIKNKSPDTKEKFASRRETQLKNLEQGVENEELQLNIKLDEMNNRAGILRDHFQNMQDAINKHVEGLNWHEKPYSDRLKHDFDEKYKEIACVKISLDKRIDEISDIRFKVIRPIHAGGSAGTYPQREEIAENKKKHIKIADDNINKKIIELQKITKLLEILQEEIDREAPFGQISQKEDQENKIEGNTNEDLVIENGINNDNNLENKLESNEYDKENNKLMEIEHNDEFKEQNIEINENRSVSPRGIKIIKPSQFIQKPKKENSFVKSQPDVQTTLGNTKDNTIKMKHILNESNQFNYRDSPNRIPRSIKTKLSVSPDSSKKIIVKPALKNVIKSSDDKMHDIDIELMKYKYKSPCEDDNLASNIQ